MKSPKRTYVLMHTNGESQRIGFSEDTLKRIGILFNLWLLLDQALGETSLKRAMSDQTGLRSSEWLYDEETGKSYCTDVWVCSDASISVKRIVDNGKRLHIAWNQTDLKSMDIGSDIADAA